MLNVHQKGTQIGETEIKKKKRKTEKVFQDRSKKWNKKPRITKISIRGDWLYSFEKF